LPLLAECSAGVNPPPSPAPLKLSNNNKQIY
jgi:hypothetical protein